MDLSSKILDLLENDAYLFWEVGELAVDEPGFSMNHLMQTVSALIVNETVVCLSQPVIGPQNADALSTRDAMSAVNDERNWQPPASDQANIYFGWHDRTNFMPQ